MRRMILGAVALAVLAATSVGAVVLWPIGTTVAAIEPDGDVQRGAYLARASGCIACHTNIAEGGAPLAGGAPLTTGFGTFYPPNLTTDPDHGIGDWTIESFARAVRQGVSPEGRPYYPAFPYPFYARFSDRDIADLWAAFQTVPPVAEPMPDQDLSFPFDQRWGLKMWRAAYLLPPRTAPVQDRSEEWNRGRWLVEGAAHCAACHTARNFAGARLTAQRYEGATALPGGGKSPSIKADALRDEGWDTDSLAYALKSGIKPDGDVFGDSMAEVVADGTAYLTPEDRTAIAIYLLDEGAAN